MVCPSYQVCQEKEGTEDPASAFERRWWGWGLVNVIKRTTCTRQGLCLLEAASPHTIPLFHHKWPSGNSEAKTASLTKRFCGEVAQTIYDTLRMGTLCFPEFLILKALISVSPHDACLFIIWPAPDSRTLPPTYPPSLPPASAHPHIFFPTQPGPPPSLTATSIQPCLLWPAACFPSVHRAHGFMTQTLSSGYASITHRPFWFCWAIQTMISFLCNESASKDNRDRFFWYLKKMVAFA